MGYNNNQDGERKYRQESNYDKKPVIRSLEKIKSQFNLIGSENGLNANTEFTFVWSILTANLSLLEKACAEPQQLERALLTGAGIGLTLDPSRGFAYLTVRKGKLIYDVGYRGLIKLAVDAGLVRHVKAELVYANDKFEYNGPHERPSHKCTDYFDRQKRGGVVGGYCEAILGDGTLVVETMSEDEFQEIAKLNPKSDAWKKNFSSGEMRKKTVVKRASKWWYGAAAGESDTGEKLDHAIAYLNTEGGEGIPEKDEVSNTDTQNGSSDEPDPEREYSSNDLDAESLKMVTAYVNKAVRIGATEACRSAFKERLNGDGLGYALQTLDAAIKKAGNESTAVSADDADAVAGSEADSNEQSPQQQAAVG